MNRPRINPTVERTLLDNTGGIDMPAEESKREALNPAVSVEQRAEVQVARRRRIPMSVSVRKLEVPDLPGYHLHWMLGEPDRIARAFNAGYDFVKEDELPGFRVGLGDEAGIQGNSDLGTRVSVVAGGVGSDNQASRLYLMKLPLELYEEDMAARDAQGQETVNALKGDPNAQKSAIGDNSNRYIPNLGNKMDAVKDRVANKSFNVFSTLKR